MLEETKSTKRKTKRRKTHKEHQETVVLNDKDQKKESMRKKDLCIETDARKKDQVETENRQVLHVVVYFSKGLFLTG